MEGAAPPEEDFSKLPIEDCIVHKSWKARLCGYERAAKLFKTLEPKDSQFGKFLNVIKQFAAESNVIALEKALDALLVFAENAHVAPKTAGEVCPTLVQKCLGHAKAKIKEKSQEVLLMYIEIEKHEIVMDAMIEGFAAKNPKLVSSCVSTITIAVSSFGAKALGVKSAAKGIAGLLEHANKDVRQEGKTLAVELYSWVGKAINPQLTGIKPIQMSELEAEFGNIVVGEKTVTRYLRSQKPAETDTNVVSDGAAAETETAQTVVQGAAVVDADPWDFLDPVDVLGKLPSDFEENVNAPKWSVRKDALEALQQLIQDNPRLDPKASYGEIVATLRKLITKDSNINVVSVAAYCLAGIANGLRKKFAPLVPSVFRDLLEKFKEKKPIVVKALTEAVDAISKTTSLDAIGEDVVAALDNKTPTVKMQTALFLSRILRACNQQTLPKKLLKMFLAPLVKNMGDPELTVREATAAAIGASMKAVGEKAVLPFIADIAEDKLKMTKITEFRDKIVNECGNEVVSSMVQSMHKTNAPPAASETTAAKPEAPKANGQKPPVKKIVGAKPKSKSTGPAKKAPVSNAPKILEERELSNEDVDEKADELIGQASRNLLESANWKERLEVFTTIFDKVNSLPVEEIPVQVVVKLITRKKEMNFQVLNKRFETYALLAHKCPVSSTCVGLMITECMDKFSDTKQVNLTKAALTNLCESVGLKYVVEQICATLMDMKSPKCQSEGLSWIGRAIVEFGLDVDVKMVIEMAQRGLASSNVTVRTAAVELCGTLYLFFGAQLRSFFSAEKQALLATLDSEFQKYEGQKPPAPTRKRRGEASKQVANGNVEGESVEEDTEQPDPSDMLRKDISSEITDEILAKLGDTNWKTRLEGLSQITAIVGEFKLTPNLGALPDALCARLKDSNKNLATTALDIVTTLISAVGPKMREHIRVLAPGIFGLMGDSKPAIREKAAASLKLWVDACGLKDFLEGELVVDALKDNNPFLRAEVWKWLASSLPEVKKKLPDGDLKTCVPTLFVCLEDRNPDVRKQAQEALVPIMARVQYDFMKRASERLKPASLKTVSEMLDRAKSEVMSNTEQSSASQPSTSRSTGSTLNSSRPSTGARVRSTSRKPESAKRKDGEESFEGSSLIVTGQKRQRFSEEKSLKILKWQFSAPTEDHVLQLKNQLAVVCKSALHAQMVHTDFKQHMKALDTLLACTETCPDALVDCSDLLMKWCTLRFFETNPATVIKCLELVDGILQIYIQREMDIDDIEVNAFVPYLLIKAGDPKEPVRKLVREILNHLDTLYPSVKLFPILMDGLKTKNSRQKAECLKIIADSIELLGMPVLGSSPGASIKALAGNIGDRDKDVRDAALSTMVAAHMHLGEKLYKYIGASINDKDMTMLVERLKRVKSRPVINKPPPEPENRSKGVKGMRSKSRDESIGAPGRDVDDDGPPKKKPTGMFTLGDDDEEGITPRPVPEPALIDHAEVEDILRKPVEQPKIKTPRRGGASPSRRRSSVTSVSSIGSMDASIALDNVISQVACAGIDTATNAAVQLEELLNDGGKACLLCGKVNQVLTAITMQLRMAYMTHMAGQTDKALVIMLYRNLCGMLLALLNVSELAREAGHGQLKDLAGQLLSVLLDERLESTPEGNQVVKSINVLIVKLVDKSEPTECLVAMMNLLQESLRSHTSSPKFQELVMKCIWKQCRSLPKYAADLKLVEVLHEAHTFFHYFPAAYWKQEKTDTPSRTIKTLLNGLCKELGYKTLEALEGSNIPVDGEMAMYLKKCLKETKKTHQNGEANSTTATVNGENKEMGSSQPSVASSTQNSSQMTMSSASVSSHNSQVADIFKKIADKDQSKQGISELYDFQQTHPNVDLQPFMSKSSAFFQQYIQRHLQLEANKRMPAADENIIREPKSVCTAGPSAYLEKLSRMRDQAGLGPSQGTVVRQDTGEVNLPPVRSTPSSSRSSNRTDDDRPLTAGTDMSDLQALRRRLAEIKKASLS